MYSKINTCGTFRRDISTSPNPRNSNRYNSGNRNRPKSLAINYISFSNRYKIGGSVAAISLAHPVEKSSSIQPPASRFQNSTRNTSASRNLSNLPAFNHLIFSTRNKKPSYFVRLQLPHLNRFFRVPHPSLSCLKPRPRPYASFSCRLWGGTGIKTGRE
jgi:hypothetical protein